MSAISLGRLAAVVVALIAWLGLGVQFQATWARMDSVAATTWVLLRYFTVLSNLWLAVQLTGLAVSPAKFAAPRIVSALTMAMLLVGVVYGLLLNGLLELSGGDLLADILMHKVTPVAALLLWIGFVPKGRVRRHDPLLWLLLPAAYAAYALTRGAMGDVYAYPFLDIGKLGAARVAINLLAIGAVYVAGGYAFTALDRRLGRR